MILLTIGLFYDQDTPGNQDCGHRCNTLNLND